jgi:hypothetical protein
MKDQITDNTVKFRTGYEYTLKGEKITGVEGETGKFLIDQQGNFYSYGNTSPITPCTLADKLEFLLKIGDEYLTVSEIEKRLK